MAKDWTKQEVAETVKVYFLMLKAEISDIPYVKAKHWRALLPKLDGRTRGAIEFKFQNISAVLIKHDRPYILGYKPLKQFQKILEVEVLAYLYQDTSLEQDFTLFADSTPVEAKHIPFDNWQIKPPPKSDMAKEPKSDYVPRLSKVNYIEREMKNRDLGLLGEELVMNYEKWRLKEIGKVKYIDKLRWVSKEDGDGAGFDILSKNENGTNRYIEVKTTKLGEVTPIYFSRNELRFSIKEAKHFHLYRLFHFGKKTNMFTKIGSLDSICRSEPISYIGRF